MVNFTTKSFIALAVAVLIIAFIGGYLTYSYLSNQNQTPTNPQTTPMKAFS